MLSGTPAPSTRPGQQENASTFGCKPGKYQSLWGIPELSALEHMKIVDKLTNNIDIRMLSLPTLNEMKNARAGRCPAEGCVWPICSG